MKRLIKNVLAVCLILVMVFTLSACSNSDNSASTAKTFNVYVCAEYVNDDANSAVSAKIKEYLGSDMEVSIIGVSTASEDPSMHMASLLRVSMGVAAGEIDVVIADESNASYNARSDMFCALSEMLSEEQIAALGDKALQYEMVDEEGNPTGEKTAVCGIDITGSGIADNSVVSETDLAMLAVGNAPNMEACKTLMGAVAKSVSAAT
ncbi:MAG: hypothetical protein ACOYI8_01320 [Christensenellales bacterium]